MSRRRILPFAFGPLLMMSGSALAQPEVMDLKTLPPAQQVTGVSYCRGLWGVRLGDGSRRSFKEYDLSFKTDSSGEGPKTLVPALVPTGRVGDRAFVIFGEVDELKDALKRGC